MGSNLKKVMEKVEKSRKAEEDLDDEEEDEDLDEDEESEEDLDEEEDEEESDDDEEEEDDGNEDQDEEEDVEEKPLKKKKNLKGKDEGISANDQEKQQILMKQRAEEIRTLHDTGVFRVELLHRLNRLIDEINLLNSLIYDISNPKNAKKKKK